MSVVDDAIARIQDLALACTTVTIKAAPDLPVDDATVLPLVITHLMGGSGTIVGGVAQLALNICADFYFTRTSIKDAYSKIDSIVPEFLQRLAGDPTLNSKVTTVIYPVTVSPPQAVDFNAVSTLMVRFTIPCKFMEAVI